MGHDAHQRQLGAVTADHDHRGLKPVTVHQGCRESVTTCMLQRLLRSNAALHLNRLTERFSLN
jgi:hypothetical protein